MKRRTDDLNCFSPPCSPRSLRLPMYAMSPIIFEKVQKKIGEQDVWLAPPVPRYDGEVFAVMIVQGFYKRSLQKAHTYRCFSSGQCRLDRSARTRCKACRFQRCLDAGMSMQGLTVLFWYFVSFLFMLYCFYLRTSDAFINKIIVIVIVMPRRFFLCLSVVFLWSVCLNCVIALVLWLSVDIISSIKDSSGGK